MQKLLISIYLLATASTAEAEFRFDQVFITPNEKRDEFSIFFDLVSTNYGYEYRFSSEIQIGVQNDKFSWIQIVAGKGDSGTTISEFSSDVKNTFYLDELRQALRLFSADNPIWTVAMRDGDRVLVDEICGFLSTGAFNFNPKLLESEKIALVTAGNVCRSKIQQVSSTDYIRLNVNRRENSSTYFGHYPDFRYETNANLDWIEEIQIELIQLGYDPGPIDGKAGPRTTNAIKSLFADNQIFFDGIFNIQKLAIIKELAKIQVARTLSRPKVSEQIIFNTAELIERPETSSDATVWHGINIFDYNEDGTNEIYLCGASYTNFNDTEVVVIDFSNNIPTDITEKIFYDNVPTFNDCTAIYFFDLDADGLDDVVYTDSGMDAPPWTGKAIEVALNNGNGFTRVTDSFERDTFGIRAYAAAVGDLDGDGLGEIILPDPQHFSFSKVLDFEEGGVSIRKNPLLSRGLWSVGEQASSFHVVDIDGDGRTDILAGGNWAIPAVMVFWSGLDAQSSKVIGTTRFGDGFQKSGPTFGTDINSISIDDFDLDGDIDVVHTYEAVFVDDRNVIYLDVYLQVLEQVSKRQFRILDQDSGGRLGARYPLPSIIFDINNDGLNDIIQNFWYIGCNWNYVGCYSSTFLINEGSLNFRIVDFKEFNGVPTGSEGLVFPLKETEYGFVFALVQPTTTNGSTNNPMMRFRISVNEFLTN